MHRSMCVPALLAGALLSSCTAPTTPQVAAPPARVAQAMSPNDTVLPTPTAIPPTTQSSFAPLNGTVIYNNLADGSLHAFDLATTTDLVLADPSEPGNLLPWAVAPDGRTVAVTWGTGWGPKNVGAWEAQLWLVNIDGTDPRKLLDLHTLAQDDPADYTVSSLRTAIISPRFSTFAWTPDGETIIATSSHEGQADMYAVAADGSGAHRLTDTPNIEFDIHVSPGTQDVAYASVGGFGMGGGWGNAAAWVQPVEGGEPQSLIGPVAVHPPADPNGIAKPLIPTSIDVVGWTSDNGALVQAGDNGVGKSAFWLTTPGNEPRAVVETGLLPSSGYAWNTKQGTLAVVNSTGTRANPADALQQWTARSDEIQDLVILSANRELHRSPDGTALLACNDGAGEPTPLKLWRDGTLRDLEPAFCEQRAWAHDGRFALSGNAPRNDDNPNDRQLTAGKDFAADGTLQRELPVGAVVVDWQNDALLFWAPQNDGRWQLRQAIGDANTPVGEPVDAPPFSPTLLAP